MTKKCDHEHIVADINFARLRTVEDGPVTHYGADIKIECGQCGQPFQFVGVPLGVNCYRPTTDIEGTTLSAPIVPAGESVPEGLPGFHIAKATETRQ